MDNGLVIALIRAHLLNEPEYTTYVKPYVKKKKMKLVSPNRIIEFFGYEHVGAHLRRVAHAKRSIDMLACVCKQPELASAFGGPPVGRARRR